VMSPTNYSANVLTVEGADVARVSFAPPKQARGPITIVRLPEEFLRSLDGRALWLKAETDLELHMALSLEIARIGNYQLQSLPLTTGTSFCVGTGFLTSLSRNEAVCSGKFSFRVLETCAQVVVGVAAAAVRDFGNVRLTDRATSHRIHVSKRGIALRLMFWRRLSGMIEFANVGSKHELTIEGGDCDVTTMARFSD
jgi:hypothetical protein